MALQDDRLQSKYPWDLTILLFFALVTTLSALPAPWRWLTHLPDARPTDEYELLWHFWYVKQFALGNVRDLFFTNLIYYPSGTTLAFGTVPLTAAFACVPAMLLVEGTGGLLLSFNLTVLMSITLTGYFSFLLVRRVSGSNPAGIVGGAIAAFQPFNFAHLGQLHLLGFFWVPLCLYFLWDLWESPSLKTCLHASLCVLGCAFTSLTYLAHLLGASLMLLLVAALMDRARLRDRELRRHLGFLAGGIAVGVALGLLPLLLSGPTEGVGAVMAEALPMGADPVSFVVPREGSAIAALAGRLGFAATPSMQGEAHLGFTLLVLSFVGALTLRGRWRWSWAAVAGVFGVLSLGAALRIGNSEYCRGYLPYAWLREWIPFMSLDRAPVRFVKTAHLALAVLAGGGFLSVLESVRRRKRWVSSPFLLMTVALIMAEYVPGNVATWHPEVPGVYDIVATDTKPVAVCAIPTVYGLKRSHMYYQTVHGKPITGGKIARATPGAGLIYDGERIEKEVYSLLARRNAEEIAKIKSVLADNRVKYVVLHGVGRPESVYRRDQLRLGKWLETVAETEDATLFRVF